jgi:uncharacterized membrane protein
MAFCGNCGASITQGNGFCGNCGKQISSSQSNAVSVAPANTGGSSNAGWAPVTAQQATPAPAPQPEAGSWSGVPNQTSQAGTWNVVPAQVQPTAPNAVQGWTGVAPGPAAAPAIAPSAGTGLTRNIAGALAYSLGIVTGVLFLMLEPYRTDRFVRFHAFQSIFYFVFAVAFSVAWSIAVGILMHISGWVLVVAFPLRMIIRLGMFGLWLYLMFQAYNDRDFRIPILGAIASKQAQS